MKEYIQKPMVNPTGQWWCDSCDSPSIFDTQDYMRHLRRFHGLKGWIAGTRSVIVQRGDTVSFLWEFPGGIQALQVVTNEFYRTHLAR